MDKIYLLKIIDKTLQEDWQIIRIYKEGNKQQAIIDFYMFADCSFLECCLVELSFMVNGLANINEGVVIESTLED